MPHFIGRARQRGSGFGSLAIGVGRVALPFAKKVLLPNVQSFVKELFVQSLPEILEVATKKKSFKRAVKTSLKKTVKKQMEGVGEREKSRNNRRKRKVQRSRSVFLSEVKNVT